MRFRLVDQAKKEFPVHRLQSSRRQPKRLFRLEGSPRQLATAPGRDSAGACPFGLFAVKRNLWPSAHDTGIAGTPASQLGVVEQLGS